jgi:hypothetical protein
MGQVTAWTKFEATQWQLVLKNNLTRLNGTVADLNGKTVTIDDSAILMGCQFGCGKGGKLANYNAGRNCNARDVKDGNGESVCAYLIKGAGQEVSCFTGVTATGTTGTTGTGPVTECGPEQFNAEGPLEILVGRYTFRFSSAASADTVKKYLDIIQPK